jgi:hypothetical protein
MRPGKQERGKSGSAGRKLARRGPRRYMQRRGELGRKGADALFMCLSQEGVGFNYTATRRTVASGGNVSQIAGVK